MTPDVMPRSAERRFVHIDCLRGLAALLVALHHFLDDSLKMTGTTNRFASGLHTLLYDYVDMGRLGVLLFFFLSGYCIANSILRPGSRPVARFAVNRILRVYPAYWLSLAIAAALYGSQFDVATYAVNIPLVQTFVGQRDVMGVYWTLPVELGFYAFCIALFLVGFMGSARRLCAVGAALFGFAVVAALARASFGVALPYAWPFFLSLMVSSAALRRMDDLGIDRAPYLRWAVPTALIGMLVIAVGVYGDPGAHDKTWYREFIPSASALCLFLFFSYVYRPSSRVLAYLGLTSYSLYLFHSLVFDAVAGLPPGILRMIAATGAGGVIVILLAATIAVASLTYFVVEKPGIRLGHRLARVIAARADSAGISDVQTARRTP